MWMGREFGKSVHLRWAKEKVLDVEDQDELSKCSRFFLKSLSHN